MEGRGAYLLAHLCDPLMRDPGELYKSKRDLKVGEGWGLLMPSCNLALFIRKSGSSGTPCPLSSDTQFSFGKTGFVFREHQLSMARSHPHSAQMMQAPSCPPRKENFKDVSVLSRERYGCIPLATFAMWNVSWYCYPKEKQFSIQSTILLNSSLWGKGGWGWGLWSGILSTILSKHLRNCFSDRFQGRLW